MVIKILVCETFQTPTFQLPSICFGFEVKKKKNTTSACHNVCYCSSMPFKYGIKPAEDDSNYLSDLSAT